MTRLRVHTPSRLHFGLLGWGPLAPRQFGGVGLMIQKPGLEVLVENAAHWEASGLLADRSLDVARSIAKRLGEQGFPVGPLRVTTVNAPDAHVGLGVGTQLSLALARALTEFAGLHQTPVDDLARLTGRGRRSGIGIHGFAEGGLIVNAGRRGESGIPTRLMRFTFPPSWSILLVLPGKIQGLHGPEEINAFRSLPSMPEPITDRLCRFVLLGLLPAALETDLHAFGSALSQIQQMVGGTFAPVQGGRFTHFRYEFLYDTMIQLGLHGVGQSSWGPTLYGFSNQDSLEREELRRDLIEQCKLDPNNVFWTKASDSGATISAD